MGDVRLWSLAVSSSRVSFGAVATILVPCRHRSSPDAARELPRSQLRQVLLLLCAAQRWGAVFNGRARLGNAVPCTKLVRPSRHRIPPRYTGDFTSSCQLSTAELRLKPVPNFSWCGRAGSVAPFASIAAARRTARRWASL